MLLSQLWRTPEDRTILLCRYIYLHEISVVYNSIFFYIYDKQAKEKSGKEDKERKKKRKSNNRTMRKRLEGSRNKNEREMKMSKIKK